jgi:hypothetical protein
LSFSFLNKYHVTLISQQWLHLFLILNIPNNQAKTQNHHVKPIRHVFTGIDKNKHPGDKKHPEEKEIETDRTLKP